MGSGSGRFVLTQCVRDGALDLTLAPRVDAPDDKEADRTRIRRGDILVTIVGEVGRIALVSDDPGEAYVSQSVALVRPDGAADPRYLELVLRAPGLGRAYFGEKQYGVGRGHLLLRHLREMPLPIPSLSVQAELRESVAILLSRLEVGTTALNAAADKLRLYRASLIGAAARGSLNARAKSDGKDWIEFPRQWASATLPELTDNLDARRVPVNAKERSTRVGSVPYYGATGQVGWIDGFLFDEELLLLGEDGAPFLDPFADKAYIIRGRSWVNNHAHVLRPNRALMDPQFLLLSLNALDYRPHVNGTTRLKLTQGAMNRIVLPVPPLDQQRAIAGEVDRCLSIVDVMASDLALNRRRSLALRGGVLDLALTGRSAA